jgi:signal transduction histidine kinase
VVVFLAAAIVYKGVDMRTRRMWLEQREGSARILAVSISHGMTNVMVSAGQEERAALVAEGLLRGAVESGAALSGCDIRNADGAIIYGFRKSPGDDGNNMKSVVAEIESEGVKTGEVEVYFDPRPALESENTQQLLVLGYAVASLAAHHLAEEDFFQIELMVMKMIEEAPDALYAIVTGPDGEIYYEYKTDEFKEYITEDLAAGAAEVSLLRPFIVQDIGETPERGKMVEVSALARDGNTTLGAVRIGYSMKSITKSAERTQELFGLIILGFTVAAAAAGALMARNMTRPLALIAQTASSVWEMKASGEYSSIEEAGEDMKKLRSSFEKLRDRFAKRGDEIGDLSESFLNMTTRLDARLNEIKSLYQRMAVADRFQAMGQLSAGIAHEINNPLAIISTYVSLSFWPDQGLQRLSFRVQHRVRRVQHYWEGEPLIVRADENKLRQVFLNVMLNASHAMLDAERKALKALIRPETEGNNVVIVIEDTGCGIRSEDLSKIFNPFFTTKQSGVGTGMGLAISYNIVAAHGGKITAESEHGRGSRIKIVLPRV